MTSHPFWHSTMAALSLKHKAQSVKVVLNLNTNHIYPSGRVKTLPLIICAIRSACQKFSQAKRTEGRNVMGQPYLFVHWFYQILTQERTDRVTCLFYFYYQTLYFEMCHLQLRLWSLTYIFIYLFVGLFVYSLKYSSFLDRGKGHLNVVLVICFLQYFLSSVNKWT